MLSSEQNDEECDATDDHSSNDAGKQINKILVRNNYKKYKGPVDLCSPLGDRGFAILANTFNYNFHMLCCIAAW